MIADAQNFLPGPVGFVVKRVFGHVQQQCVGLAEGIAGGLRQLIGKVLPRLRGHLKAAVRLGSGIPGLEEPRQQKEGRRRCQEAFFGFPKFSSHVGS